LEEEEDDADETDEADEADEVGSEGASVVTEGNGCSLPAMEDVSSSSSCTTISFPVFDMVWSGERGICSATQGIDER
jgi:hypothetical protein